MKRLIRLLVVALLLAACSSDDTNAVKLYEVADFDKVKKETVILYTTEQDVAVFEQAVEDAIQLPGIVDVYSPMYLFEAASKSYYLWLHEEGGSLMDVADTHTIYQLTEQSATTLKELLQ
ncbi:MAG: hypothetical protein ABS949_03050 [Solibacillus sp.]